MFDPVTKLQEFIRCPSVSTDSKFADGMRAAIDWYVARATENGK